MTHTEYQWLMTMVAINVAIATISVILSIRWEINALRDWRLAKMIAAYLERDAAGSSPVGEVCKESQSSSSSDLSANALSSALTCSGMGMAASVESHVVERPELAEKEAA